MDFYMTAEKPKVFTDKEIARKILDNNLLLTARVRIDNFLVASAIDEKVIFENARKEMIQHFANSLIKKSKLSTIHSPLTNETVIQGELIAMTKEQLFELLGDLGVKIQMTPQKEVK